MKLITKALLGLVLATATIGVGVAQQKPGTKSQPTIGSPQGTRYTIISSRVVTLPAPGQCGVIDNRALYREETLEIRTDERGRLVKT